LEDFVEAKVSLNINAIMPQIPSFCNRKQPKQEKNSVFKKSCDYY